MFAYLSAVLNMLTKPFQNEMYCRPINQLIITTGLQEKAFFNQQLGNSPFVYDSNVHFARQINGRCNAASVAALFLEDMQTFPQSANGNRLFPDNRAPSWEILSSKSNSSFPLLLQDEAASALSRTQMSGHIHPKMKCPVNLQKQTVCERMSVLWWEKWHLSEEGLFHIGLFFHYKMVANAERRDDITTWPTFYSIIWKASECPLPVSAFVQTTGPGASVDQKQSIGLTSAAFKSGSRQIHT